MKSKHIFAIAGLLVIGFSASALARPATRYDETTQTCRTLNSGPLEMASRPYGEGGQLFTSLCKSCHYRNNDQNAPFLWAESKTSKAWNRLFANRYALCAKNGSWETLSQEQTMRINDYLYRFSYDGQGRFDNC